MAKDVTTSIDPNPSGKKQVIASESTDVVLRVAASARKQAYEFALRYIAHQQPESLAQIKELRETAELLEWAAEGRGSSAYDIDAVVS